jgi:hypothetical protein
MDNAQNCDISSSTVRQIITTWEQVAEWLASSGMLRRVALVRTDVSEELSASFIK